MLAVRIRAARSGDWAKLKTLVAGICRAHGDAHALTRKDFDRMVCMDNAPVTVMVAETAEGVLAGYVAGFVMYEFHMGQTNFYIQNLFVAEEFRRQRVGEILMLAIMKEAREKFTANAIRIGAEEDNANALSLYRQLGFLENEQGKKTVRLIRET
ncbi:MAG TPA: N-acetyltransferase [Alphaproteobacteria bacterium]|nr:N-acetyltransferase [Alphaproteobacteria bacterium]HNS43925.1 N-acetyltransferase [Alphaproteobacteria bacterium]